MAQGQAARVVADLAPMLLDEGYPHAAALRRERRTFLDALHLLLVRHPPACHALLSILCVSLIQQYYPGPGKALLSAGRWLNGGCCALHFSNVLLSLNCNADG
jgi:hypothetical protein